MLILCMSLFMVHNGIAQSPGEPASAAELMRRADSAITAQVAATQTLVARGKVTVEVRLIKKAEKPTKKNLSEYTKVALFTFTSAESGGLRRWEAEWHEAGKPPSKDIVTTNGELDYRFVSDEVAYIDPASSFDGIIFDFHRDHRFKYVPLGATAEHAAANPKSWSLKKTEQGRFLATETLVDSGIEYQQELEIDPQSQYLPTRYQGLANTSNFTWKWKKLKEPEIWYPSHIVRKFLLKFADGDVFEETSDIEVASLEVNQDIDPALFTLAGLGIQIGAKVYDSRVSPLTSFSYLPDSKSANQVADRLLVEAPPIGVSDEPSEAEQSPASWMKMGAILVAVSIACGVLFGYLRHRKA